MKQLASTFLLILCVLGSAFAQNKNTSKADEFFKQEAYLDALEEYREAYTKESSNAQKARIIFQIAECYRMMNDMESALSWYERSARAKHTDSKQYYYWGRALMQQGKYSEAQEQFQTYQKKDSKDPLVAVSLESCQKARAWISDPTRWQVKNEEQINSSELDFAPAFLDKRNTSVIFTSSRKGSSGDEIDSRIGENFQDIWLADRDRKGRWSEPVLFHPDINTEEAHEGSARLNYKRNTIYFTRCEYDKKEKRGCDLYKADYIGSRVANMEKMDLKMDFGDSISVGQPAVDKREEVLVFSSDMPGGQGGKDLWMIAYDKKEKIWSKPKNLGPQINTPADDMFPFIHADGSLYFSSNGRIGLGGLDIYHAELLGENRWGNAENVQVPLNSPRDDYGIVFNKDKKEGFFSSNRDGGRGKDDIYSFYFPPLLFALQGTILDKDSGKPIEGATVEVVGSDGKTFQAISDANGKYEFVTNGTQRLIEENVSYGISVSKQEHLIAKDKISTVGAEESMTFVVDFLLQYSPPNKAITLPEVQYALASWELLENSKDSLNFLYDILMNNPNIVVELQAHTDTRGDAESNMELSQKRAESCVNYLISKGIDPARMRARGFGETMPRISDAEIEQMETQSDKETAHQKNRRTEFAVISTNYVPGQGAGGTGQSPGGTGN